MIIKTLLENTAVSAEYQSEHGLSLYLETRLHKILFDFGKSRLFLENAAKMGVDISKVDMAILSHGHSDHGGGLKAFLQENQKAKVYIHAKAFERHYAKRPGGVVEDIGLDPSLKENERIILTGDHLVIDEELELFADVRGQELCSLSNQALLMDGAAGLVQDTFAHEQNLIVTESGKTVLLAGCAHRGIVNIVKSFIARTGRPADCVIGGFHLFNPGTKKSEEPALVHAVGQYLKETGSFYGTCHCTGPEAFAQLREVLGNQIHYCAAGDVLEI